MYLGAYDACLFDKSLGDTLDVIAGLGLTSVEINSGGFLPPVHLPVDELRASADAREAYLAEFSSRGLTLTALNCNGNPLHPAEGFPHSKDLLDSIELAALLGVKRVVTMSGTPGGEPGTTVPVWNPLPWWSPFLDVQDHQWEVAVPYWKDVQQRAADADVRIAIEMHPGNIVFNPRTMHRLAEEIGATHVGAEMDPSHLFWQGIDPVLAVADLGDLVYNAAAKDTRINEAAKVNGVIDDSSTRVAEGSRATSRWVVARRSAAGRATPRGTSSPSVAATTRPTGPSSCAPCRRSTPTCPSTSSTRTRSSTSWKACGSPLRPCIDAEKAI